MAHALIGSSGFVGSNLGQQHVFDGLFNSQNIADVKGQSFNTVVCAAAPAVMWLANKHPEQDLANINKLIDHLKTLRAQRFVLISTIAVLDNANAGYTEQTARFERNTPYGTHRRILEEACQNIFPQCYVLRLPALYGTGLKKNFLFDVLNPVPSFLTEDKYTELLSALPSRAKDLLSRVYAYDDSKSMYDCNRHALQQHDPHKTLQKAMLDVGFTALNFTNPASMFQFYGLHMLWADINRVIQANVPQVHMAPLPLAAADVYHTLTGNSMPANQATLYQENMQTSHGHLWNSKGGYICNSQDVLTAIKTFYQQEGQRYATAA